MPAYFSKISHR